MAKYIKVPVTFANAVSAIGITIRVSVDPSLWPNEVAEHLTKHFQPGATTDVITGVYTIGMTCAERITYMRFVGEAYLEDFEQGDIISSSDYSSLLTWHLKLQNRVDISINAADMIIRDCGGFDEQLLHARHFPDKSVMVIEDHDLPENESLNSIMVLGRRDDQFFLAVLTKRTQ